MGGMPSPAAAGVGTDCVDEHAYGTMLRMVPAPESMPPITFQWTSTTGELQNESNIR
jgi:hypothetical protein